ncbi:MAG: cell division protein FtsQ/DivIB [Acidimicrobiia bacterium]|jgi:cell division protein FtsQ
MSGTSTLERPTEVAIDPRIRARRIEVRRHEGRRRLSRLIELGLVAGVAAAFAGALFTPLLDVDEVTVAGTRHLQPGEVLAAAGIEDGAPLVAVDLRATGERIAALPWVAEVELHRGVDGVVALEVDERVPVATVPSPTGSLAVDEQGRVLGEAPAASAPALATLALPGSAPAPGDYLPARFDGALALAAALADSAPGVVVGIDPEGLVATLAAGGQVRFGDADRMDAKLRSLSTVLGQVDLTCLAEVDLRLPGSPVLTREEGCS